MGVDRDVGRCGGVWGGWGVWKVWVAFRGVWVDWVRIGEVWGDWEYLGKWGGLLFWGRCLGLFGEVCEGVGRCEEMWGGVKCQRDHSLQIGPCFDHIVNK